MIIEEKYWDLLRQVYRENRCPGERICRNEAAVRGFARELSRRAGVQFDLESIKETLERIRKNPKTTGGLPHIGRAYDGPRFLN